MADTATTVTTINDLVLPAAIAEGIIREARGNVVISDKIATKMQDPNYGPKAELFAAHQALAMSAHTTEGAQADAVAWSTDGTTVTAAVRTLDVLLPLLASGSVSAGVTPALIAHMGRAAITDHELAIHALHSSLSAVVGSTGVASSLANFRTAQATLRATGLDDACTNGNAPPGMRAYVHPTTFGQWMEELATSAASIHFQPASASLVDAGGTVSQKGFMGLLYGTPVYETTAIVTDGTDLHGALIYPDAYGAVVKFLAKYDVVAMPWLRSVRHMTTNFSGVAVIKNAAGVEILGVD